MIDLPVGNNLQDHVMSDGIEFFTPHAGVSITAVKAENFLQSWSYSLFGAGAATVYMTLCLALFSHVTRAFNILHSFDVVYAAYTYVCMCVCDAHRLQEQPEVS